MTIYSRRRLGLMLVVWGLLGYAALFFVSDPNSVETIFLFYSIPICLITGATLLQERKDQ